MKSGTLDRLLRAGADGFAEHFRAVLDSGPADAALYERALEEAEPGARRGDAEDLAWRGRLRACLGRPGAAEDLAAAAKKGQPRAAAWRAAIELAQGRFAAAAALPAGPKAPEWDRFLRACALLAAGRGEPARGALTALARGASDAAFAAGGVLALDEAARGGDGWRARLRRAAAARPRAAWPWVLVARLERAAGRKTESLRAAGEAVRREDAAWTRLERSRLHEALGDMDRALDDADAAVARAPESAGPYLWRAHIQTCRRHYHLATPDFTRALAAEPASVEALRGRAGVALTRGRPAEAYADARSLEKAAGGGPEALFERARVQILAGEAGPALDAELRAAARRRPDLAWNAAFLEGLARFKGRRFDAAARLFARSAALSAPEGARLKASFYGAAAAGLAATADLVPPPARRGKARLFACGLGIAPPYTATLQALRTILACDFVFNNLSEPEISDLVWALSSEGEPAMFDIRGADKRWTQSIFRRMRPGRTVGFVTRGHPLVCGGLAASLMEEARRVGADFEVQPAVSSMNTLALDALPPGTSPDWGFQVLDYSTVFAPEFRLEPRVPTVLYFNATAQTLTPKQYARFCDRLEAEAGAGRRVLFYGRSFSAGGDPIELSSIRGWHGRIDPSYTLLIPPRPA